MKPAFVLIHLAIETKYKADQARLTAALREQEAADDSFQVWIDQESGQTILGGMEELHLDSKIGALRRDYRIDISIGAPQVAYLETITQRAEIDFTLKQTGSERAFARVKLSLAPRESGEGNAFVSGVGPGLLPEAYVSAIERGVHRGLSGGVLAGFPVVRTAIWLIDCAYHDRGSSAAAFEDVARRAMREGLQKGRPVLFEPVMTVEIRVPEDGLESVLVDLRQRRCIVRGQESSGAIVIVSAIAPLANLFGYRNALRSLSEGRAIYSMQFSHYAAVLSPEDDGPYPAAMALRMPAILTLGDSA